MLYGNDQYTLSANGTVFTREKKGIIPTLLERWYSERKKMQDLAYKWERLQAGIEIDSDLENEIKKYTSNDK
jgi:DNA polymerase elongation subunit (family B)